MKKKTFSISMRIDFSIIEELNEARFCQVDHHRIISNVYIVTGMRYRCSLASRSMSEPFYELLIQNYVLLDLNFALSMLI